jgi:hypothetical protein
MRETAVRAYEMIVLLALADVLRRRLVSFRVVVRVGGGLPVRRWPLKLPGLPALE